MLGTVEVLEDMRQKLKHTVGRIYEIAAVVCFLGFFVCILAAVFWRYVLAFPLWWSEELSRMLYIYMVFLAAVVAVDEHLCFVLGIEFVRKRFPTAHQIVTLLVNIVVLVVLSYLVIGGYDRFTDNWPRFLPATGLRCAWFYLPVILGSSLLLVHTIIKTVSNIFSLWHKTQKGGK